MPWAEGRSPSVGRPRILSRLLPPPVPFAAQAFSAPRQLSLALGFSLPQVCDLPVTRVELAMPSAFGQGRGPRRGWRAHRHPVRVRITRLRITRFV